MVLLSGYKHKVTDCIIKKDKAIKFGIEGYTDFEEFKKRWKTIKKKSFYNESIKLGTYHLGMANSIIEHFNEERDKHPQRSKNRRTAYIRIKRSLKRPRFYHLYVRFRNENK